MFIRVRAKRLFTFFFFLVFHCPVSILLVARVSWISNPNLQVYIILDCIVH